MYERCTRFDRLFEVGRLQGYDLRWLHQGSASILILINLYADLFLLTMVSFILVLIRLLRLLLILRLRDLFCLSFLENLLEISLLFLLEHRAGDAWTFACL